MFSIGIDVGSTTVKIVVRDEEGNILKKDYQRHLSKVREKAAEMLEEIKDIIKDEPMKVAITGSAGLGLAQASSIDFVQEVFASAKAVEITYPGTNAVIELGGEDAKIIFFDGALEERMNGSCAGGTGAFIDQMATLLDVSVGELDELALRHERIYSIASRCGVFAKTDIQPLLNQGARKEDVAASIFQAVVDQTIAGLAQGRKITGQVVFLGGPLFFFKSLRKQFEDTLKLEPEHTIFPATGDVFVAIGASMYAEENSAPLSFKEVYTRIVNAQSSHEFTSNIPPLFKNEEDYQEFIQRHGKDTVAQAPLETYRGKAYLGVDAGSTTTKLVLINPKGEILYSYYASNKGNPVAIVKQELDKIYESCLDRIEIAGAAVTGYGEDLIKNAFSFDLGIVETMAHLRAAQWFDPQTDFIMDIGGQDMKCFKIVNNTIDSIMLNEACSSGCGSFIETFAKSLGYQTPEFAKLGLFAKHPVNLGSRCTVFMNSSVKQAQKEGASVEDISAGLSISVVKNALYKVIRANSADDLGKHIVVQGGTFLNDSILRSFEEELHAKVTRPTISGLMGAFGAAISVMEMNLSESKILTPQALLSFEHQSKSTTCGLCTNHCNLTINNFGDHRRFISGNRCERPLGIKRQAEPLNMFKFKLETLRGYDQSSRPEAEFKYGSVGIPFGLNMTENLPFWAGFFNQLGVRIVLSHPSNRAMYRLGQYSIPSDTVCYPAKLMHGVIEDLLDQGLNKIFYPCLPYNFDEKSSDNHYNCPVVAYYPELLRANVERLINIDFMDTYFGLHRPKDFKEKSTPYFMEHFGCSAQEVSVAIDAAYQAYEDYRQLIVDTGAEYIKQARSRKMPIIVLSGRPYHVDSEINHGIDDLLSSFNLCVVTEDAVAHLGEDIKVKVLNQWTYHSRLYHAAQYVTTQKDMQMIQLVSFGCGIDAITTDEVRSILQAKGKFYTQLKIDEINNLGAVRIRVRSLLAAMEKQEVYRNLQSKGESQYGRAEV